MIYTSYFSAENRLPRNIKAISIAKWPPRGWKGESFQWLFPPTQLILDFKRNGLSPQEYVDRYRREVLNELDPDKVAAYLQNRCMLCFERPESFCHRHIIWRWLLENGYDCEEYGYKGVTDDWLVSWP